MRKAQAEDFVMVDSAANYSLDGSIQLAGFRELGNFSVESTQHICVLRKLSHFSFIVKTFVWREVGRHLIIMSWNSNRLPISKRRVDFSRF